MSPKNLRGFDRKSCVGIIKKLAADHQNWYLGKSRLYLRKVRRDRKLKSDWRKAWPYSRQKTNKILKKVAMIVIVEWFFEGTLFFIFSRDQDRANAFLIKGDAFLMTPLKGFGHPFIKNQDRVDFFNFPSISPLKFFIGWFFTFADQAHDTLSEIKIKVLSKSTSLYKNRCTLSPL